MVQVPVEVDEAVLQAALQASMQVQTVAIGQATVSAPPGTKTSGTGARVVEEEIEEMEDSDDEEEATGKTEKKPAMKTNQDNPVQKKPAGKTGEIIFASGWKKVFKKRKTGQRYATYYNPQGKFFPSKERAKEEGGFKDED